MNLGEKIYSLRTEKNLSQGDLAERLEVSRQSVSKWETGSAVPDLDKIIKLSDIFGVTLDDLVKGEDLPPQKENSPEGTNSSGPQVKYVYVEKEQRFPPRKIAALILLCMGFVLTAGMIFSGGGLSGAVFAIPFWVACLVCFAVPKHTAIWALWADYIILDIYLRYASAANPAMVFNFKYYSEHFTTGLIVSCIWVIVIIALIIATAFDFRKEPVKNPKRLKTSVSIACVFIIVKDIGLRIFSQSEFVSDMFTVFDSIAISIYFIIGNTLSLLSILLIAFIAGNTVRLVLQHPKKFEQ